MEMIFPVGWTIKAYEGVKAMVLKNGYREIRTVPYAEMGEKFAKDAPNLKGEVNFIVFRKEL